MKVAYPTVRGSGDEVAAVRWNPPDLPPGERIPLKVRTIGGDDVERLQASYRTSALYDAVHETVGDMAETGRVPTVLLVAPGTLLGTCSLLQFERDTVEVLESQAVGERTIALLCTDLGHKLMRQTPHPITARDVQRAAFAAGKRET